MNLLPRRASKGWIAVIGRVALVVVVLAACEAAGWPFLATPVQHALSKALQREVLLNSPNAPGAA